MVALATGRRFARISSLLFDQVVAEDADERKLQLAKLTADEEARLMLLKTNQANTQQLHTTTHLMTQAYFVEGVKRIGSPTPRAQHAKVARLAAPEDDVAGQPARLEDAARVENEHDEDMLSHILPSAAENHDFAAAIGLAYRLREENAHQMSLFWGALDLRPRGSDVVCNENHRATDLLEADVLVKIQEHYESILEPPDKSQRASRHNSAAQQLSLCGCIASG
ncbi:hypothetical protein HDU88_007672 [Geranomyces variabilis]|nr:hypothetical protein HDU88_007672 [Geranomyces variabilis]